MFVIAYFVFDIKGCVVGWDSLVYCGINKIFTWSRQDGKKIVVVYEYDSEEALSLWSNAVTNDCQILFVSNV